MLMNIIHHKPDLTTLVMPLVRMLSSSDLSWADRADISEAIQKCTRHWKSMEEEKQQLNQVAAQQQCGQAQALGGIVGYQRDPR